MVLVRRIRKRGANIVVEANGEVLFAPTGDFGRWTNRFSQRTRAFAAQEAPVNKRSRWAHYGKPLRSTFTASTVYQPGRMKVYSAIGSSAPHAAYVDQGTGIYASRSPWKAKILPPTGQGASNLYEHTWHPGGPQNPRVRGVTIKGQKGQFFFDKGLQRAFRSMRMRSYQVPGDARITDALNSFPSQLENFAGNTPADGAFIASLTEWREWRDAAFRANSKLGESTFRQSRPRNRPSRSRSGKYGNGSDPARSREVRRERERQRSKRNRDKARAAKSTDKPKQDPRAKGTLSRSQDRLRVKALAAKRFGAGNIESIEYVNGRWNVVVREITIREADGQPRPEFKSYWIKARS